jgi:hypothetical protein
MSKELDLHAMSPAQRIERLEDELAELKRKIDPPCQFSIEVTRIFGDGPEQKGRPHYILMNEGMTREECQVAADELRKKEEESGTQIRHEYKVVA